MKNIFIFLLFIHSIGCATAQTFPIGQTTVTFVDSSRSNRPVPAVIYYPATVAGIDQPVNTAGPFSVIVFGHGAGIPIANYTYLSDYLVSRGFIVAFPNTETSSSPNPASFAADFSFVLKSVKAAAANSSSLFWNAISAKSAMGGHSLGGGCSIKAAATDTTITCVFNFAAAAIFSGSTAINVRKPLLMFGGKKDCVCPVSSDQQPYYTASPSLCKALVSMDDADHCQFAAASASCLSFETACGTVASISETLQQTRTLHVLLPFLQWQLQNNLSAKDQYDSLLLASPNATSTWSCAPLGIENTQQGQLTIIPNPASDRVTIKLLGMAGTENASISITDLFGREMVRQSLSSAEIEIVTSDWSTGQYHVRIVAGGQNLSSRICVIR